MKAGVKTWIACLCAAPSLALAAEGVFADKDIAAIHSGDSRPCSFFTLAGVGEADPLVPNSGWFSIAQAHPNYKPMVAMMLMAKATGKKVYIVTTGTLSVCGHAEVSAFIMQ